MIGREFLLPNDPAWSSEDLLRAAVEWSGDKRFVRKRAAYWRWQDEFLRTGVILDQNALEEAV